VLLASISTVVNIDAHRYDVNMSKATDPDVRLLGALADPVRLSIVRQLSASEEVCACDFDACASVSQPTVSHHLRILREAGVVRGERRGTWIWYSLEPEAIDRLRAIAGGLVPGAPRPLVGPAGGRSRAGRSRSRVLPVLQSGAGSGGA
jgi:ArsR family transcriptional regulator